MKIVRKVAAPAEYIFEVIIRSSKQDIYKMTGEKVTTAQMNGYEYKRRGKNYTATTKIDRVVQNEEYTFTTKTVRNTNVTSYLIHAIDDKNCEVTVDESMTSFGLFQKANDKVMTLMVGWLKKRQINAMLDEMGKQYAQGVNV
jgi:hypothetical protein